MLILEAESMNTMGDIDRAVALYNSAIQSAHEHKFIHEEAIASELAGIFYHKKGFHQKAYAYLSWGAHAVARRVGTILSCKTCSAPMMLC